MLSNHVTRYVALHQRLGLRFDAQRRMLERYARYAEAHGDRYTLIQSDLRLVRGGFFVEQSKNVV